MSWAASRAAVARYRATGASTHVEAYAADGKRNPWESCLNEFEIKSLAAYRSSWPNQAYSLSQNGATGFAMHSTPESLHTLIRNLGLVWSDAVAGGVAELHLFVFKVKH